MKILHTVQFYHPSVGGMQEVVKQISERLVKFGHDVTIATTATPQRKENLINGVKVKGFNISGNLAYGMSGDIKEYRAFVLESNFDIVTNFAAQQWAADALLPILDQIKAKKVFVPTGFSGLYNPAYRDYFANMPDWMRKHDLNIFLSDNYRDILFAREHNIKNLIIIPNGADEREFMQEPLMDIKASLGIPGDHLLILHVGSHTGIKGHSEAIQIFAKADIRKASFLLIANSFGGGCSGSCNRKQLLFKYSPKRIFDDKRLIIASLPRMETIEAYKAADLFLFPSNLECSPLVLFECMASATPFLTTDVGNSAEIISWSGAGELLPTQKLPNGLARAHIRGSAHLLTDLVKDTAKRKLMGQAGYTAWQQSFTWEKIARDYEIEYNNLLEA